MERELEVKVIGPSVEDFKNMMKEIGASFLGEFNQINYIFKNTNLKGDDYLRLRDENGELSLTLKKSIDNTDARENLECTSKVYDKANILEIFANLGMDYIITKKKRLKYKLDQYIFDIDNFYDLGFDLYYMEIEAPNFDELNRIIKKLGIKESMITRLTIRDLFDLMREKNKL